EPPFTAEFWAPKLPPVPAWKGPQLAKLLPPSPQGPHPKPNGPPNPWTAFCPVKLLPNTSEPAALPTPDVQVDEVVIPLPALPNGIGAASAGVGGIAITGIDCAFAAVVSAINTSPNNVSTINLLK